MKKVLSFTLASLALAALASPAHAQFGGSVRGDVGMLSNQVPYMITTATSATDVVSVTHITNRKEGQWDFTGRLFVYTSCAPCSTYVAASWQGGNHNVHTCHEETATSTLNVLLPLVGGITGAGAVLNLAESVIGPLGTLLGDLLDSPVATRVNVKNKFSKAKLGMGFELIKTCCFTFTMEVGGNYLDAKLDTDREYGITQTVAEGAGGLLLPGGLPSIVAGPASLVGEVLTLLDPFDYVLCQETCQKTEGVGLYASFRADYKFPASCLGNCFGIYGKAEVADIIGRQSYSSRFHYENGFTPVPALVDGIFNVLEPILPLLSVTALTTPDEFEFVNCVHTRYNNVVEVDIEAGLTYAPCFKCWDNLNLMFALGVRTDSFVNLFSEPVNLFKQTYLSLTRPTVFFELEIKV